MLYMWENSFSVYAFYIYISSFLLFPLHENFYWNGDKGCCFVVLLGDYILFKANKLGGKKVKSLSVRLDLCRLRLKLWLWLLLISEIFV